MHAKHILEWYIEAGVDEAVEENAINRLVPPAMPTLTEPPAMPKASAAAAIPTPPNVVAAASAIAEARKIADGCNTREELEQALRNFDGVALKKMAQNTVFSDGNPKAKVMLIGEAPGANEDEQGIPFCGQSGKLLDNVLASAGLTRKENIYISNTIFWRPPGNRTPSEEEVSICEPFVEKHIALINPDLLIACGSVAAGTLLKKNLGIGRLRGKSHGYTNRYLNGREIPTVVIFHPSYLLRSPGQKRLAWHDMLMIQEMLEQ